MSPLVAAALASSVSTLQLLLDASASADAMDQHQRTALTAAAATGSLPSPGKMFLRSRVISVFGRLGWKNLRAVQILDICIFDSSRNVKVYIYIYIFELIGNVPLP